MIVFVIFMTLLFFIVVLFISEIRDLKSQIHYLERQINYLEIWTKYDLLEELPQSAKERARNDLAEKIIEDSNFEYDNFPLAREWYQDFFGED